jgi:DNA topoisomerase IB
MKTSAMVTFYLKKVRNVEITVRYTAKILKTFALMKICVLNWTSIRVGNIKYYQEYNFFSEGILGYGESKQHKT